MDLPFTSENVIRETRPYWRNGYCWGWHRRRLHAETNDYPTAARADYVIGCMAANGNTREALLKCSCAIDTIAALMPYSHYEQAETALSLQAGGGVGGRVGLFRDPPADQGGDRRAAPRPGRGEPAVPVNLLRAPTFAAAAGIGQL